MHVVRWKLRGVLGRAKYQIEILRLCQSRIWPCQLGHHQPFGNVDERGPSTATWCARTNTTEFGVQSQSPSPSAELDPSRMY